MRVAGGFIVAVAGWKLLNQEPADREASLPTDGSKTNFIGQAFYPLTLPLTTGPGSIAVMISLAMTQTGGAVAGEDVRFLIASLLAIIVTAVMIYGCYAYADRVQVMLGQGGTDIALRITAFILFCLGVQILWTGLSELIGSV
jgi:multiple antibiotic resistance protein